jgi:NADH-quinone oxidoreductase subunit A
MFRLGSPRICGVTGSVPFKCAACRSALTMATYIPLFLLFLVGAIIAIALFTLTSLLGPKNPTPEKMVPYECGSESTGGRFVKPSVKFYLTAILFVVFDIEAVLIYPWTVQFRSLGWMGLASMTSFVALLVVALLYVWKKGALEWEK